MNVVDVDTRELVSSWILHSTVSAPVIMRSYDVDMVAGQHLAKKIVFKNPWDIARRFFLQSSDETVMRVRYSSTKGVLYLTSRVLLGRERLM